MPASLPEESLHLQETSRNHMLSDKDRRIEFPMPFLKDGTVLYVDSRTGTSHYCIEDSGDDLLYRFNAAGYTFAFLPDLVSRLSPDLLEFMFPGQKDIIFAEDMYQRIQDLAGLDDKTGFLYRQGRDIYFRVIPEGPVSETEAAIREFIDFLDHSREPGVLFSKKSVKRAEGNYVYSLELNEDIRFSIVREDNPLDPKAQAILEAWDRIEREFGVSIQDVEILLGYRVKLSHLNISTSGKVSLPDYGGKEVKMDDLSKAVYFCFLRHPEGIRLKEMRDNEEEVLKLYMGLTGRDDLRRIRRSVHNFLDPYGNNLNVCMSRIKKAFRDIVGDRIARFYYVDGRYAEPRKVALDRDYVIWEH